eukprot:TRINITY_DN1859_c1_g3_i1.p1 TRINITY_DN1859_c1_g3~~TRINITY_DN1859_c1_g3_i1.p1  ORF type:complete len:873 (-),score=120.25 TRINITY_DN1859_c1_g3_i1:1715-4333(-)
MEEDKSLAQTPTPLRRCDASLHWSLSWLNGHKKTTNHKSTATVTPTVTATATGTETGGRPLSEEAMATVLGFCDPLTLFRSGLLVCRQWSVLLSDDRVWHEVARHAFGGAKQWYDSSLTWKQWCQAQCIFAWSFMQPRVDADADDDDDADADSDAEGGATLIDLLLWAAASGHNQLFKNVVVEHGFNNRQLLNLTYVYAAMVGSVDLVRFLIGRNLVDTCESFSLDDRSHAAFAPFTGPLISGTNKFGDYSPTTVGEYTTAEIALGLGHKELLDYLTTKHQVPITPSTKRLSRLPLTKGKATLVLEPGQPLPVTNFPIDLISLINIWAGLTSTSPDNKQTTPEVLSMFCHLAAQYSPLTLAPVPFDVGILTCCLHQRYDGAHVLIMRRQQQQQQQQHPEDNASTPTVDWAAEEVQLQGYVESLPNRRGASGDKGCNNLPLNLMRLPRLSLAQLVLLIGDTTHNYGVIDDVLHVALFEIAGRDPVQFFAYLLCYYSDYHRDDNAESVSPPLTSEQQRVVRIVLFWIRMYPMDFASVRMRTMLSGFADKLSGNEKQSITDFLSNGRHEPFDFVAALSYKRDTDEPAVTPELLASVACYNIAATKSDDNDSHVSKETGEKEAEHKPVGPAPVWNAALSDGRSFAQVTVNLFDYPPRVVAEQLALFNLDMMQRIHPRELFDQAWMKTDKIARAPHIVRLIQMHNHIQAGMVQLLFEDPTESNSRYAWFVYLLQELVNLHDYNGLMTVFSVLTAQGVGNLQTDPAHRQICNRGQKLLSPFNGYKNMWDCIRCCIAEDIPCLPFLGNLLTNVMMMDAVGAGHPSGTPESATPTIDTLKSNKIWSEIALFYTIIHNARQLYHSIAPIPQLHAYFATVST